MLEQLNANYYMIYISYNIKIKISKNNCTASTISYFCCMLLHRLRCDHNPAFQLSLISWSIASFIAAILFLFVFAPFRRFLLKLSYFLRSLTCRHIFSFVSFSVGKRFAEIIFPPCICISVHWVHLHRIYNFCECVQWCSIPVLAPIISNKIAFRLMTPTIILLFYAMAMSDWGLHLSDCGFCQ